MANIIKSKMVKTRKEHVCFFCAKKYPKNTRMILSSYTDNGTVYSTYCCKVCDEYMMLHFESGDESGFGEIYNEHEEEWKRIEAEILKEE